MIHSSYYRPRVYPYGSGVPAEIDRLQDITAGLTLNREKIKEIGRDGTVGWRKRIPSLKLSLKQLEYGSLEFFQKLANKETSAATITLNDFKTSMIDICGYKTDDDASFLGTVWYPKLRLSGFSINIGDPQANIERTFDLTGEDEIFLENNNQYLIFRDFTANGGTNETFVVSDGGTTYPDPVGDPDNSGYYLLRVDRVRAGTASSLTYTTDYTYNSGTKTLTVLSTTAGDEIRVYWSAATYITGATPFTNNDSDLPVISADSVSIYLESANYLYRLQSVGMNISFDRTDYYEIGDDEVVQRGIKNKTCSITLGRILEAYTIEEVARGVAGLSYGKINPRNFATNLKLIVRIYSSAAKSTLKLKYTFDDLTPVSLDGGTVVDDYITRGMTLEGEALTITTLA